MRTWDELRPVFRRAYGELGAVALARTIGVCRSAVWEWDSGRVTPTGLALRALAEALVAAGYVAEATREPVRR